MTDERQFPSDFVESPTSGNVDPQYKQRPKRPGVRIHADTDLVQIMADPELPEKAVWYGVQNDMLVMCNEVYPDNMKLAFSLETSMRYEVIRPDHMYYDQVMDRVDQRTYKWLEFNRIPGQGLLIRLRQGIDPAQGLEDLQTNGLLIRSITGNYDNDYKSMLCVSASEIWQIALLETTNYLHSTRKRFVPYHHF